MNFNIFITIIYEKVGTWLVATKLKPKEGLGGGTKWGKLSKNRQKS